MFLFLGELAALSAAALWATATTLYGQVGRRVPALALNGMKGVLALILFGATLALQGAAWPPDAGDRGWVLALSGLAGIGLGDTAYFAALNRLGPRRALLLESLAPVLAALLAWGLLGERLGAIAWTGIATTVGGVVWVVAERAPARRGDRAASPPGNRWPRLDPRRARWGVAFGLVAALAQAGGSVLSRSALADGAIPPLWSAAVRLGAGLAVPGVAWAMSPSLRAATRAGLQPKAGKIGLRGLGVRLAAATTLGTYAGIWLQQIALQRSPAGIAQTLLSTTPIFVLPLAAIAGDRPSPRAIAGAFVAVAGVGLLILGR